jgi:hypothetical protein
VGITERLSTVLEKGWGGRKAASSWGEDEVGREEGGRLIWRR